MVITHNLEQYFLTLKDAVKALCLFYVFFFNLFKVRTEDIKSHNFKLRFSASKNI